MADRMTKKQRGRAMSAVKSAGNMSTELALINVFRKEKITEWKRGNFSLPGKPDFIFFKKKIAVFVDGCFWHGCVRHRSIPKTNRTFWVKKINGNIIRDKMAKKTLRSKGWKVLRVWEHDVKSESKKLLTYLSYIKSL